MAGALPPRKAVVLAAGKGTRLQPLSADCPKPMMPVAGRPLLEHTIRHLARQGVAEIGINLHFRPEIVKAHFGNGTPLGVRIHFSEEAVLRGTAGALNGFRDFLTETFYVIYGDVLFDVPLVPLYQAHRQSHALVTIGLHPADDARLRGMVARDGDGRVRRFIEKPVNPAPGLLANTGIYVMEPAILDWIPAEGASDFGADIFPALVEQDGVRLQGEPVKGTVIDIGSPGSYAQACAAVARMNLPAPAGGSPR